MYCVCVHKTRTDSGFSSSTEMYVFFYFIWQISANKLQEWIKKRLLLENLFKGFFCIYRTGWNEYDLWCFVCSFLKKSVCVISDTFFFKNFRFNLYTQIPSIEKSTDVYARAWVCDFVVKNLFLELRIQGANADVFFFTSSASPRFLSSCGKRKIEVIYIWRKMLTILP